MSSEPKAAKAIDNNHQDGTAAVELEENELDQATGGYRGKRPTVKQKEEPQDEGGTFGWAEITRG